MAFLKHLGSRLTSDSTPLFKKITSLRFSKHFMSSQVSNTNPNQTDGNKPKDYPGNKVMVEGVHLHYEKVGKGDHTILLLPGALGSARTDFGPQLELLDRNKYTLIAWDPPGYGYSRPPDRNFSGNFYFNDALLILKMMQKLGHTKYSTVGWSDGGITAMIVAAMNPAAVSKLVVWGCNAFITIIDKALIDATADTSLWSAKMKSPLIKLYGEEYFEKMWSGFVESYKENFKEDDGNVCREVLPNIHCPTLILHGDKDPMVDPQHPIYLNTHIRNSKLIRMADGKHNIHLRYAKEFNDHIEKFLSS